MDTLYFDNNATTFVDPAIVARSQQLSQMSLANPASQHRRGRAALRILEQAKAEILELIDAAHTGMSTAQVILTSGGTEANNLAIHGLSRPESLNTLPTVLVSGIEHPSVLEAAHALQPRCRILPVDAYGRVRLEVLEDWLKNTDPPVGLVSVMLGNNETGVLQDLASISLLCHQHQALVHSDIVQAVGKIPFSMQQLQLDAVTLTAHKLHGPVGIGALVLRHGITLAPQLFGGGQQLGLRPGTEPVVLADNLAQSLRLATAAQSAQQYLQLESLRDHFEAALVDQLGDLVVVAADVARLPHTSQIAFLGVERQALLMALDLAGIECSTGSACASGSGRPSHVLMAMGLPNDVVQSALRFSFSRFTSPKEVDLAIERIVPIVRKLRT